LLALPRHPFLQALKLDLKNGHSWYIVGNAYLALFFGVAQSKEYLQQVGAIENWYRKSCRAHFPIHKSTNRNP
jgi:hypothetical protein